MKGIFMSLTQLPAKIAERDRERTLSSKYKYHTTRAVIVLCSLLHCEFPCRVFDHGSNPKWGGTICSS